MARKSGPGNRDNSEMDRSVSIKKMTNDEVRMAKIRCASNHSSFDIWIAFELRHFHHAPPLFPGARACKAARRHAFWRRPLVAADKNRPGTFQTRPEFDFHPARGSVGAEPLRLVDLACQSSRQAQTCRRISYLRS